MRQARDTTRWEGAARGNTTAASKGIKLHRWGGTHLLGGHITDYAHHLASQWHPTGGTTKFRNTPARRAYHGLCPPPCRQILQVAHLTHLASYRHLAGIIQMTHLDLLLLY